MLHICNNTLLPHKLAGIRDAVRSFWDGGVWKLPIEGTGITAIVWEGVWWIAAARRNANLTDRQPEQDCEGFDGPFLHIPFVCTELQLV